MASAIPPKQPSASLPDAKKPVPSPPTAKTSSHQPSKAAQDPPTPAKPKVDVIEPAVADAPAEDDDEQATETIDMETFNQILDLDEDDTHDFSRAMAWAYFSQVSTTFGDMDSALETKDLEKLSSLGHFLKGSSAALGVNKVQRSCEKIQHYGHLRDEDRNVSLKSEEALKMIDGMLTKAKKDYNEAERWLKNWYKDNATETGDLADG